eukprot:2950560-Pyramimonas_sp.AAC.1
MMPRPVEIREIRHIYSRDWLCSFGYHTHRLYEITGGRTFKSWLPKSASRHAATTPAEFICADFGHQDLEFHPPGMGWQGPIMMHTFPYDPTWLEDIDFIVPTAAHSEHVLSRCPPSHRPLILSSPAHPLIASIIFHRPLILASNHLSHHHLLTLPTYSHLMLARLVKPLFHAVIVRADWDKHSEHWR